MGTITNIYIYIYICVCVWHDTDYCNRVTCIGEPLPNMLKAMC